MKKRWLSLLLPLCLQAATAHPHAWVNLTSDFLINADGDLYQLNQRWIFDPFYSALSLDDVSKAFPGDLELGLAARADEIIHNLEKVHYYSHLTIDQQAVDLGKPTKWHLSALEAGDDTLLILEMHFNVPVTDVADTQVDFTVYDPTYYVDMRHDSLTQVRLKNASTLECEPQIIEPEPNADMLSFAASLDKTQSSTNELGKYFAQTVEVTCI